MLAKNRAFSRFAVNDLETAKAFYRDTLGLDVSESYGGLTLPVANGATIMVYPKPDHPLATFSVLH